MSFQYIYIYRPNRKIGTQTKATRNQKKQVLLGEREKKTKNLKKYRKKNRKIVPKAVQ